MLGSLCEISGESLGRGDAVSSQSPRSTDAVIVAKAMNEARSAASKTAPREGGQEAGSVKDGTEANRLYETKATAVSEGAKHVADPHPAKRWKWAATSLSRGAEASVWTERMVSALDNGVKGCKATQWFGLMDKVERPSTLAAAWQRVARNSGAAGVDRQSIERFAADREGYLSELSQSLSDHSYRPQAVKRVDIAKHDGKTRPLGIPTVKDRIVQTALKFVLEPIFEAQFLEASYGFRPGLSCKDALSGSRRTAEGRLALCSGCGLTELL